MVDSGFLAEVETILRTKIVLSRGAQENGEGVIASVEEKLEEHLGYSLLNVPRSTKKRQRLLEKSRKAKADNPGFTAQQVADEMRDLAGCRILVIGVSDVEFVHQYFCQCLTESPMCDSCRVVSEPEVFLENAKEGGFRGLIQDCDVILRDGSYFPFELQVMTHFEHSWDQLEHGIYELKRKGIDGAVPPEIKIEFESLSDELYKIDRRIDEMRRAI